MSIPGTNRSGTLDIGYLIAQAMQRSCLGNLQSVTSQLSEPTILAALIVPQIEAFLASNVNTRFLILHFPFNHLRTVFEIRKLLGTDLFKIAGILNSLASDPPSMSGPRTPLSSNPLSNDAVAARNRPDHLSKLRSRSDPLTTLRQQTSFVGGQPKTEFGVTSFSKANFLLPSTATDAEITAFLSGIWKALMERSPFYTPEGKIVPSIRCYSYVWKPNPWEPGGRKYTDKMIAEPEPKPVMPHRPSPPPPTPSTSSVFTRDARDRDSGYPASTFRGAPSKVSRLTGNSEVGSQNNYESSVLSKHKSASSIASTKTTERGRQRVERGAETGWENFYIQDDDSEDDEYDRKVLGRAMEVRATAPKRDKKKALKCMFLTVSLSRGIHPSYRAIANFSMTQGWALRNAFLLGTF